MRDKNKCVIFDFDGVIYDTEQINFEANQLAFEDSGVSFSREQYKQLWIVEGLDLPDIVNLYHLDVDPEVIRSIKNKHCMEMLMQSVSDISDEVRNTIELLICNKWKISIGSSNSENNIFALLDILHIRKLFDAIVGLESISKVKPEPDVFIECLNRTCVSAKNAVVVEDAPKGIIAAKRAKIGTVVAIPNSWTQDCDFSNADIVLDSIKELPDAIN